MIDFNTSLIEAGYLGEHNATELVIVKPVDVIGAMYSVAFMTNGEVIHSKYFYENEEIRVPLWQQLTQDYELGVQLEAYDEKGDYLGKSAMITLLFGSSAHGTDVIADAENPDVYSEIALNTWFRETLEDNVDTLNELTTREDGKLLFKGKLIEGTGGTSGQLDIQVETDTENEYVLSLSTPDETIITPNLKGKEGKQGVSGVYVGSGEMPEGYNVQIDPTGEAAVIPTKTSELINDSGYLTAEELLKIEPNSIPDYWNEHLENKIKTIKSNQEKGGKDCFSFVVITDIHYDQNLGKHSPLLAKKIMEECNIKYALVLGDLTTRALVLSESEMENSFVGARKMLEPLSGKALLTQGNHDGAWGQLDSNAYCYNYTPKKIYERIYRPISLIDEVHFDKSGTGYYVDDVSNKTRYIIINTHCVKHEEDADGTAVNNTMWVYRCTQSQFDMVVEALNSVSSEEWNVVVGSHIPFSDGFNYTGDDNDDYFLNGSDIPLIRNLLTAYNKRKPYSETFGTIGAWDYVNVNTDFTNAKGRVLGCFSGHVHIDGFVSETLSGVPVITTRCDSKNENFSELSDERIEGTVTEQSFDVITIDKVNRRAYITKIGAGNDREVSLDDSPVYVVSHDLTNAVIINEPQIIRENSRYTANVIVKTGYEISSVTVTMGDVDITSTAYANGVITIEKVTNDISVVVTAEKSLSYINQIPLSVDKDGSDYVGNNGENGYNLDTRLSSSTGEEKTEQGMCCTGFIPCVSGQTIRIANVAMIGSTGVSYIIIYDRNKNFINAVNANEMTENNGVYSYAPSQGSMAFIRLSIGEITDESIVTIDEEIGV
jgi:hypothetical protein